MESVAAGDLEGLHDGIEGLAVEMKVGDAVVGPDERRYEGSTVGKRDGSAVGNIEGLNVGTNVGVVVVG